MGIIPDPYNGEWKFRSSEPSPPEIFAIHSFDAVTPEQQAVLEKLTEKIFSTQKTTLGCTTRVELVIKTTSAPIKQRYYSLSPALQKVLNAELDEMLQQDIVELC